MNVDTVETQTSSQVTEAATAEQIKANYHCEQWGLGLSNGKWGTEHNSAFSESVKVEDIIDLQSQINTFFSIDNLTINDKTRPTIQLLKNGSTDAPAGSDGYIYRVFSDSTNYMSLGENDDYKIDYETTFGCQDIGVSPSQVCGEGTYWFKLDQASQNGYGICFDNHTGCGFFSNYDYAVYFVRMKNGIVSAPDTSAIGRFVGFAQWPEYKVQVHEENGKASITLTPANDSAGILNGTGTAATNANRTPIVWSNLDVSMNDVEFTQAYGFYYFGGIYFADSSVTVEVTKTKAFGDIVYEPSWTDGALHMLINMDTASDSTMLGKDNGTESKNSREARGL